MPNKADFFMFLITYIASLCDIYRGMLSTPAHNTRPDYSNVHL